jgi:hypothetical protein
METSKNESDIAPIISDANPQEINLKKIECCDLYLCYYSNILLFQAITIT